MNCLRCGVRSVVGFGICLLAQAALAQQYSITTVAGETAQSTATRAIASAVNSPTYLTFDPYGNLFFISDNAVFKIDPSGVLSRFAGASNQTGFSGDGGVATGAVFNQPKGLAADQFGNVYIGDSANGRVRRVDVDGVIRTVATLSAVSSSPRIGNVALDGAGNVYFDDNLTSTLFKLDGAGNVTVAVENFAPEVWIVDAAGNIYRALYGPGCVVDKITPANLVTRIAGDGVCGSTGDGVAATSAGLMGVTAFALDTSGNLYLADATSSPTTTSIVTGTLIRRIGTDGIIHTVGGNGTTGAGMDGVAATQTALGSVVGLAVGPSGEIDFADDEFNRIRRIAANGTLTTIAGVPQSPLGTSSAFHTRLNFPTGLAVDAAGSVYVADTNNNVVRKILLDGTITTIAGNGVQGDTGDNMPATQAELATPWAVAVDAGGNVYIAEYSNRVRKVSSNGIITTFAGTGTQGFSGDGGPATEALLHDPTGLGLDAAGNLYIADAGNARVRKVTADGIITTVAGSGSFGCSGDGGSALDAAMQFEEYGIAVDGAGNLYLPCSDGASLGIRKVDAAGKISTVVAQASGETGVAVDPTGNLYFSYGGLIEMFSPSTGATVALSQPGQSPEPSGIAVGPNGLIYFADYSSFLLKVFVPPSNPLFSASITHEGNLYRGQTNASYSVAITNSSGGASNGAVTLAFEVPAGFHLVSGSGSGWNCGTNTCSRNDALLPQAAYPPLLISFSIDSTALPQVTVAAIVSGGGSPAIRTADLAFVFDEAQTAAPALTLPANGSGHVPQAVTLGWTGASNTWYDVFLGTTNNPPLLASVSGPAYTISGLVNNATYSWKVIAHNATGSATSAQASFATGLNLQAISFPAIPDHRIGDAPFTLTAISSIGAPVAFSVVSGPATINGNTLTITGAGTITVEASAPATATFASAAAVQTFTVAANAAVLAAVVNAASYAQGAVAPASLASVFGQNLCAAGSGAVCSLFVTDAGGQTAAASLLYISPDQINFLLPSGLAPGSATLLLTNESGTASLPITVATTAPGLFSASASGTGAALGSILHVATDGTVVYAPLATCSGAPVLCSSVPIAFDSTTDRVFLVLYGTGIRGVTSVAGLSLSVGGTMLPVAYGGPQNQFEGLDQINVEIPRSLAGTGQASLQVLVNGEPANTLTIDVQ